MSEDEKKLHNQKARPKRFYQEVAYEPLEGVYQILLDDRPVKTPMKNILVAPTADIAHAVVNEWDAQIEVIDPALMMLTKMLNTAIDRIPEHKDAIIDELVSFAGTDMICYRASDPESLVALQRDKWDPLLNWLKNKYDIHLQLAEGIIHASQDESELDKVRNYLKDKSVYFIAAFHSLTTLSSSVAVAMACAEQEVSIGQAWECAHLDANWQALRWGIDEEAETARENAFKEFNAAAFIVHHL